MLRCDTKRRFVPNSGLESIRSTSIFQNLYEVSVVVGPEVEVGLGKGLFDLLEVSCVDEVGIMGEECPLGEEDAVSVFCGQGDSEVEIEIIGELFYYGGQIQIGVGDVDC